jgi:hypothetical protein
VNRSRSGHLPRGSSTPALRRIPVTVFAFVVLMILPPAATAASGADPSNPSLDQYVESVPTSHGGAPPGPGSTRGSISTSPGGRLPASIRHRLAAHGGADATQFEAIATSPAFGAPAEAIRSTRDRGGAGGGTREPAPAAPATRRPSALDAVTNSATHAEGGSTGLLVFGLVLITALLAGTALARKRFGPA